jgi:prevent-host-death family protein
MFSSAKPSADPPAELTYKVPARLLYALSVDVAVSTLRAELADWIERVRGGEEVVVTDRGTPVARLVAIDTAPLLEQLTREGVLSRPRRGQRPAASGAPRVHARRPVSELVGEQRR